MRTPTVFVVLALAVTGTACTGSSAVTDTAAPSVTASAQPTSDVEVTMVPGEWVYEYLGVKASFEWKDGPPVLTVKNVGDEQVGAPSLYVVTKDQRHVDATFDGSTPLDPDGTGTFTVRFPGDLTANDIGLVVLELGNENWGALTPKFTQK